MSSSQRNWRCSDTDKAANYLGLMRKAGRIALGEYDAGAAARAGQACLLLLAQDGMTMLVVTHEMAFARDVSNRVVYMNRGVICEDGTPEQIFGDPQKPETREFLARFIKG